jgi:tRNA uridine 5-carbamoylmethylation protein Kti12
VIIVSGIPGSGKGRMADYLARQLAQENLETAFFKMNTVQD